MAFYLWVWGVDEIGCYVPRHKGIILMFDDDSCKC